MKYIKWGFIGCGEVAEINMVDFIDPGVAEPLVGVQDALEEAAGAAARSREGGR